MTHNADDLSLVLDVHVQVTVELGRKTLPIGMLMQLVPPPGDLCLQFNRAIEKRHQFHLGVCR